MLISLRMVVAAGMWLLPAAALAAPRGRAQLYQAGLCAAAAATAGVLAAELTTRRGGGDDVTTSCLVALELHEEALREQARTGGRPNLRSVLPCAA